VGVQLGEVADDVLVTIRDVEVDALHFELGLAVVSRGMGAIYEAAVNWLDEPSMLCVTLRAAGCNHAARPEGPLRQWPATSLSFLSY
jgi:hypothetical protein